MLEKIALNFFLNLSAILITVSFYHFCAIFAAILFNSKSYGRFFFVGDII